MSEGGLSAEHVHGCGSRNRCSEFAIQSCQNQVPGQIWPIVPIEKSTTYVESAAYGRTNPSSSASIGSLGVVEMPGGTAEPCWDARSTAGEGRWVRTSRVM